MRRRVWAGFFIRVPIRYDCGSRRASCGVCDLNRLSRVTMHRAFTSRIFSGLVISLLLWGPQLRERKGCSRFSL